MPFTFSPKLIATAVEEVAEKHRTTSRAGEEIIQEAARQLVAEAYEYAGRYNHDYPPSPTGITIPSNEFGSPAMLAETMRKDHRQTLLHFFIAAGVSQATANQIVDTDILHLGEQNGQKG